MADRERLEDAGFSSEQIEALFDCFTVHHHHHDVDEIDGLQDEIEDIVDAGEEDNDD